MSTLHSNIIETAADSASAIYSADPAMVEQLKAERARTGADRWDEVWDGVYVMNPLPNDGHQEIVQELSMVLGLTVGWPGLGKVRPGVNVSDRAEGWQRNYRGPDLVVFLNATAAHNHGTHWQGGPDFLVEVASPGDSCRDKLPFYGQIGTREALIIDRNPWSIELYRLQDQELVLVGRSTPGQGEVLDSTVLPLLFRLVAGEERPRIEVTHEDGQQWLA